MGITGLCSVLCRKDGRSEGTEAGTQLLRARGALEERAWGRLELLEE